MSSNGEMKNYTHRSQAIFTDIAIDKFVPQNMKPFKSIMPRKRLPRIDICGEMLQGRPRLTSSCSVKRRRRRKVPLTSFKVAQAFGCVH